MAARCDHNGYTVFTLVHTDWAHNIWVLTGAIWQPASKLSCIIALTVSRDCELPTSRTCGFRAFFHTALDDTSDLIKQCKFVQIHFNDVVRVK